MSEGVLMLLIANVALQERTQKKVQQKNYMYSNILEIFIYDLQQHVHNILYTYIHIVTYSPFQLGCNITEGQALCKCISESSCGCEWSGADPEADRITYYNGEINPRGEIDFQRETVPYIGRN